MLYARRIAHKGLRLLYVRDDGRKLNPEWVEKIKRILSALNIVTAPREINFPGFEFHELQGDRKGTFSVTVRANWRVTFLWDSQGPYRVNLEDYHGH